MESLLLRNMFYRKIMVRLNFIKNVLYLFMYCMSARRAFFISGIILSSWHIFLKKWNLFLKDNCHVEKMIVRSSQTSLKDVLHCFHKVYFLCKTIVSYLKEYKTVLLSRNFQCALIITPFLTTIENVNHTLHVV